MTDYCFDFPVPFKKGDILYKPRHLYACNSCDLVIYYGVNSAVERIRNIGDESDMDVYGLFLDSDGRLYHEVEQNYMDFEFYRDHFDETSKTIPLISKFVKGKLSLDIFLALYEKMLLELSISKLRKYHLFGEPDDLLEEILNVDLDLNKLNEKQDKLKTKAQKY